MYTVGLHTTTPDSDELHQLRVDLDSGHRLPDDFLKIPVSASIFYSLTPDIPSLFILWLDC